jgi:hypothetical protein
MIQIVMQNGRISDLISRSMVKSASGKCHGSRVQENCIGGLSLCGKEKLAS